MELVGTHTQVRGWKRPLHSIGVDTRRSKNEMETKDYLEKNGCDREKQGGGKSMEITKTKQTLLDRDMIMMMREK